MKINTAIITMLVILAIVLFVSPFLIYGYYFHDLGVSKINANWGSFGSFLSGVFSFFTALFTLASVVILVSTFRKTIHFNQQQIQIAKNESELNNFNFIIGLIQKNIKENSTLTIRKIVPITGFSYEMNTAHFKQDLFSFFISWAVDKIKVDSLSEFNADLFNLMMADENLKMNANKYAKKYAEYFILDFDYLNNIYPLIKVLCIKILDSDDDKQREILKDILLSAIDENVLYWSLAVINNNKFDSFMILPSFLKQKFYKS